MKHLEGFFLLAKKNVFLLCCLIRAVFYGAYTYCYILSWFTVSYFAQQKMAGKHTKADHDIKLNPKFVQSVCLYVLVRLIYWGLWVCLNLVSQDSHRAYNCQFNFTVTFHKIFTVIFAGAGHWYEVCFFWAGRADLFSVTASTELWSWG